MPDSRGSGPGDNPELKKLADSFFERIMIDILKLFSTDRELFEQRGSFIIRQLSIFVDTKKIFKELAGILLKEEVLRPFWTSFTHFSAISHPRDMLYFVPMLIRC